MEHYILSAAIAVLAYYYLTRLFGAFLRWWNWGFWYRKFYLNSLHWRFLRWRKLLQQRFLHGRNFCEKCGRKNYLQIHHEHYKTLGHEKLSILQIVCKYCHHRGSGRI